MSKIEVDTIAPQSGTQITLGESGDTITIPAGATFDASSGTLTLADGSVTNAKLANSAITINGSSVSLGGSTTIETGTSWQSTIVTGTTLTAEAGKGYWINTTSNACTITLPASASVGDQIIFTDYARNWATNAVTLNTNSLNFQGGTTNVVYNTNGQSVDIVYSGATKGWIPNVDDDVPNSQAYSAEYLVVAGGASGSSGAGAGGAGGMLSNYGTSTIDFTISSTYTAVVGAGGAAVAQSTNGNDGGDSTLSGTGITTITAFGGGGGANGGFIGRDGGSGGGGAGGIPITVGGSGTVGQGNDGGQGSSTPNYGSGGGGGAGAVGGNGSGGAGGAGGTGLQNAITGTNTYYAGGGTGNVGGSGGGTAGSLGGGGSGGRDFTAPGNGTDGLGGGGGGGGHNTTRSTGGSGVVILRVATANYSGTTTGSPTVTTDGTDTIIKFTGNGTYTAQENIMAHFAKLGVGNKVIQVDVVNNNVATTEQAGIDFLNNFYGTNDVWVQTSYNTRGGVHILDGTPFRKNYAGVGFKYDQTRDAFIAPKPFNSWLLNETTCQWEAPVAYPDDDNNYTWNESTQTWDLVT